MGYSRGHRCTLVLAASIAQRSNHFAVAFVPGPRSLAPPSRRHVCRQQHRVINCAVRKRAPVLRSAVAANEAGVLGLDEGDSSQGRSSSSAPFQPKRVFVAKGKARLFWDGNPLVYGGAVSRVEGNPAAGEVVDVVDSSGKFIAWGVYNPDSMYRVRVLVKEGESLADDRDVRAVLKERLRTARDARRAIGIPNPETDAYRLINGEGDRLSGLVIDVFARVIGVSSSAVWVEVFRSEIEDALKQEFGGDADEIVWRRSDGRLQQDGWKGRNGAAATPDSTPAGQHLRSTAGAVVDLDVSGEEHDGSEAVYRDSSERVNGEEAPVSAAEGEREEGVSLWDTLPATVVRELGLEYEVHPQFGQKTGFYCDQRESREAVRKLSAGKKVLDMFCYSGGFALNAAVGGATRVVAVDSSQPAVDTARRNAARNGLEELTEFIKDDALNFMKAAVDGDKYDLVVLDPPKLAPNRKALARATSRYRRLNQAALELIAPGGLLVTFTCSAAMTQSGEFVGVVQSAAAAAGRTVMLLKTVGPAADHLTNPCYPEGSYLMGGFFYVV